MISKWNEGQYGHLRGATITGLDEEEGAIVLIVKTKENHTLRLVTLQDAEGNGPGYLAIETEK